MWMQLLQKAKVYYSYNSVQKLFSFSEKEKITNLIRLGLDTKLVWNSMIKGM